MSDPEEGLEPQPSGALVVPPRAPRPGDPRFSLVVPTLQENETITAFVEAASRVLDALLPGQYELIVVDDDSADGTWRTARSLAARFPCLRVLRRRGEHGLGSAVVRGWQLARGEVLGVMDADLQHPPEACARLWAEVARGADLAVASRHVQGGGVSEWSLRRRVLSRGAQVLGLLLLPAVVARVSDPMSGYFLVRRSAVEGVELRPEGYKILIEVLGRAGRARWISETGYVFRERAKGASKATWEVYLAYLRHLLRLRLHTLRYSRFPRFAVVGLSGVVVDMALLFLLSDPRCLGLGLTRSKLVAAEVAILNNFWWNDRWTFGDLVPGQRTLGATLRRLVKFNAICLAGLALNVALLNLQFNLLGMDRYLANAVAIAVVTAWNYLLNRTLAWRVALPPPAA
ncbi:MAG TPA: glycosyltransferase [Vicinamibacteria bacterium]|nr:glycosyltransferase [Vicinamibacteria bacterium]